MCAARCTLYGVGLIFKLETRTFDHCIVVAAGNDVGTSTADANPYNIYWTINREDETIEIAVRKAITYPASTSSRRYVGPVYWLSLAFTHGGEMPIIGSSAVVGFSDPLNRGWTIQNLYIGNTSTSHRTSHVTRCITPSLCVVWCLGVNR